MVEFCSGPASGQLEDRLHARALGVQVAEAVLLLHAWRSTAFSRTRLCCATIFCIMSDSSSGSNGFIRSRKAPSFMAATAVSTVA